MLRRRTLGKIVKVTISIAERKSAENSNTNSATTPKEMNPPTRSAAYKPNPRTKPATKPRKWGATSTAPTFRSPPPPHPPPQNPPSGAKPHPPPCTPSPTTPNPANTSYSVYPATSATSNRRTSGTASPYNSSKTTQKSNKQISALTNSHRMSGRIIFRFRRLMS